MKEGIRSLTKLAILLMLREKPRHGYELMKELEKSLGKKVSAGSLYPFLHKLIFSKIVEIKETGEREKKVYRLTEKGFKLVSKSLEQLGSVVDAAIEPKLSKCAHCGCRVYEGGYEKKVRGKKMIFCCKYCARAFK